MHRFLLIVPALLFCAGPVLAATSVENGVRVHRTERAEAAAMAINAKPASGISITLDPTYGAVPSCTSADWRHSVSRATWTAACGSHGYQRWYDPLYYRGGY